ncbi:MAG TPA: OadG family protein [bacterium]|nr:OadG family protein [bacterium]HPN31806.1 OadG family protein [bacterium]
MNLINNEEFLYGLVLMLIGMTLVFILLGIFFILTSVFQKFCKKKEITINIAANPKSDIERLEKIAVISAGLIFIKTRHASLTNSLDKGFNNYNLSVWKNLK